MSAVLTELMMSQDEVFDALGKLETVGQASFDPTDPQQNIISEAQAAFKLEKPEVEQNPDPTNPSQQGPAGQDHAQLDTQEQNPNLQNLFGPGGVS